MATINFNFTTKDAWVGLITLVYIDILNTTAAMFSLANLAGLTDEEGNFEGSNKAYIVDSVCVSVSGLFGTSPTIQFIQSCAGITEGGKTGITALVSIIDYYWIDDGKESSTYQLGLHW
ncbi:4388_t:CDS:2 [Ambispora leptoticha]|uniref:4388_t:CDS:1 n=1 Tax=Ambispora leptoticha TaxID=144679 RepID=A0A9N9DFB5_9GLOM|nr:4388_t:CDS:2 [Ambispora leptoticha]